MIGDGRHNTVVGQILPRGWAMAHYSRFANETFHVDTAFSGTLRDGTALLQGGVNTQNANINPTTVELYHGHASPGTSFYSVRVTAFVKLKGDKEDWPLVAWDDWNGSIANDIEYISFVMFAPFANHDLGIVQLNLPDGFVIKNATAMRSTEADVGNLQNPQWPKWETVEINEARNAGIVELNRGEILSVKFNQ